MKMHIKTFLLHDVSKYKENVGWKLPHNICDVRREIPFEHCTRHMFISFTVQYTAVH